MSVSIDTTSFAQDPMALDDLSPEDLIESQGAGESEDYELRASRRAQLEDAETLRRMRAL
jgi:hypothetical protein